jgi:hypothetical protein
MDFLQNLIFKNGKKLFSGQITYRLIDLPVKFNSVCHMEVYANIKNEYETNDIAIHKLTDEWYAIYLAVYNQNGEYHYIADEWEEVLGFLKNKTDLVF